MTAESEAKTNDLLIIGAGELGSRLGRLWRQAFPSAVITAETATVVRHATLLQAGMEPRLRNHRDQSLASHVLFSLPPSSSKRYLDEIREAIELWNHKGRLVFISSTAVYQENSGGTVDESSLLSESERAARLIHAENDVIRNGGLVVRLAGLYCLKRGPHRAYLRTGDSPLNAEGFINLIHYEDAARLAFAAFEKGTAGTIYLGCDGSPISRKKLAELAAAHFSSQRFINFSGTDPSLGKQCTNSRTRTLLGWTPAYESFEKFLQVSGSLPLSHDKA